MDCLFCKIVAGDIPAERVYEDDTVIAILDIKPVNPGHVLIIPRKHSAGVHDADPATLDATIRAVQKIGQALLASGLAQAFNLEQNNGELAGQLIPHLHLHVIPRRAGDGLKHWPGKAYASDAEAQAVARKIKDSLNP